MPKIYTKTGDKGFSSLYDGTRLPKYSAHFDVLGEMDELTTRIGMLCATCTDTKIDQKMITFLRTIQQQIQDFNSYIATPNNNKKLPPIDPNCVVLIEKCIDNLDNQLPKLTKFILPGQTTKESWAHMCRTQTRKVERRIIYFIAEGNEIPEIIQKYMNRLSDFFFTLARWLRHFRL